MFYVYSKEILLRCLFCMLGTLFVLYVSIEYAEELLFLFLEPILIIYQLSGEEYLPLYGDIQVCMHQLQIDCIISCCILQVGLHFFLFLLPSISWSRGYILIKYFLHIFVLYYSHSIVVYDSFVQKYIEGLERLTDSFEYWDFKMNDTFVIYMSLSQKIFLYETLSFIGLHMLFCFLVCKGKYSHYIFFSLRSLFVSMYLLGFFYGITYYNISIVCIVVLEIYLFHICLIDSIESVNHATR